MLMNKTSGLSFAHRQRREVHGGWLLGPRSRWSKLGFLKASNSSETQTFSSVQPPAASPAVSQEEPTASPLAPSKYRSIASLSSVASLSSLDDYQEDASFRFLPSQLEVFNGLAKSMQNCSRGLAALAFGSVVMNAFEVVEHAHHHAEHAAETGAAAAGEVAAAVAAHGSQSLAGGFGLFQEVVRSVSLTDVALCVNEIIPALLVAYAAVPFRQLSQNPDEPHMALALKGVGRLSVTLQQLAWTSGSVAVVLLLTAAAEYPPIVVWASWSCLGLSMARGAALWWVLTQHTTSGAEVARTLAALRGVQGQGGDHMNPLDRAASWLALGVLLQAEERLHADHYRHHNHSHTHHHNQSTTHQNNHFHNYHSQAGRKVSEQQQDAFASSILASPAATAQRGSDSQEQTRPQQQEQQRQQQQQQPHYTFDLEQERMLRSLVEAAIAAGLSISLLVLATLALGLAEGVGESSNSWVSSVILAAQKAANATALFTSAAAFDRALHNDDGNDDSEHLLYGLGSGHNGVTGLFNSMAVLSLALLMAGSVALLIPSLEESPVGVLLGDGLMHASADLLVDVMEAL